MTATAHPPNRAARNEAPVSLRRFVNDEVASVATGLNGNDGSEFEFVCECGDLSCLAVVTMTLAQFRASPPGSVVGH